MRDIKFRGKCKWSGKWYYGYYSKHDNGPEGIEHVISYPGGYNNLIDPNSVGQYTGLKDKNGKEIYEGDVVRLTNETGFTSLAEIQFNDGCFDAKFQKGLAVFGGIHYQYTRYRDYVKVYVANHAIEIIGNTYENPELLEGEPHA